MALAWRRLRWGFAGLLLLTAAWAGGRTAAAIHLAVAVHSLRGRTVAVDPGHGGLDPGAIGPYGVNEDTIVLAVSLDLARMLRAAGATVVLTRDSDLRAPGVTTTGPGVRRKLYVRQRMDLINASGADVLVSVHANHFRDPSESGAQTFYNPRSGPSEALAKTMQAQLIAATHAGRRSASEEINHYLLDHARMPAVTVEIGFLSNPAEARRLETPTYQHQVADAMFVALAYWFADGGAAGAPAPTGHPATPAGPPPPLVPAPPR